MQQLLKEIKGVAEGLKGELKSFYEFHGVQLITSGFPTQMIETLHRKLLENTYDVGDSFKIMDNQDSQMFFVETLKDMKKGQDVWVLDHLVTFRYPELRTKLQQNQDVLERLKNITKYLGGKMHLKKPQVSNDPLSIEMDSQQLQLVDFNTIPKDTVCLSLVDNKLSDPQQVIDLVNGLSDLKILWINDNPVEEDASLNQFISKSANIQLFNSKLTNHSNEWVLKYLSTKNVAKANQLSNEEVFVLDLSDREIFNMDIKTLTKLPNLHVINITGTTISNQDQLNQLKQLIRIPSIRLIRCDFALELQIFKLYNSDKQGINKELLVNDHNLYMPTPTQLQSDIDEIHRRAFKLAGSYRLQDSNKYDETCVWYINDELGSAFTHSDHPQVKLAPFLYVPNKTMDDKVQAYTLMWLISDVKQGSVVERDFLSEITENKMRSSRLVTWYDIPKDIYIKLYKEFTSNLQKISAEFKPKPDSDTSYVPTIKEKYKVVTDSILINQFLTLPEFEVTENIEEVDLFWTESDVSANQVYKQKVAKGALNNHFNVGRCLVSKTGLANTIQSNLGITSFLQRTYDLNSELPIFLGHFFENQRQGLDNLWISKPPHLARSIDMMVSDNLETLVRNMQTGPKLVQKYITNPVKRLNRKIDLRFIVAAKSIFPLNVYIYKHFWIRTSNNEYNIDCRFREEYQTHFTVMNYGKKLTQVNYPDFIEEFNKDYSPVEWSSVYDKIKELLRQTFTAVQARYPNMHDNSSREYYGVDIMVDENTMEPKLLEFTFSPDCNRACKFFPSFYNDLFEVLFLERENANVEPLFPHNKN